MGFDDNYFSAGLHHKLKGEEREAVGSQLIGGTLCVFSVMVLLDSLLTYYFISSLSQAVNRTTFSTEERRRLVGRMHQFLSSMLDIVSRLQA